MLRERIANDRSALTDEFRLGEENSDPIKVHPDLNNISSPRQCVCVFATSLFPKRLVASTRIHLLSHKRFTDCIKDKDTLQTLQRMAPLRCLGFVLLILTDESSD